MRKFRHLLVVITLILFSVEGLNPTAGQSPNLHCVITVEPLQPGQVSSTTSNRTCFNTVAESVAFATNNRIQLPATASASDVSQALRGQVGNRSTLADIVIGIHWDWTNRQNASIVWRSSVGCGPATFTVNDMTPNGWNDRAESAEGFSGCNHFFQYEHINLGGAVRDCNAYCSDLGVLNNQVSSWRATS